MYMRVGGYFDIALCWLQYTQVSRLRCCEGSNFCGFIILPPFKKEEEIECE